MNSEPIPIETKGKPCCVAFNSPINNDTASALMAVLADSVNNEYDEIHLLLNTPGGSVQDGIALYTFIKALPARIVIYNISQVNSIGNAVYQAGDLRLCAHGSSFMFHGVGFDIVDKTRFELKQLRERTQGIVNDQASISEIIERHTLLTKDDIDELFLETAYLRAEEAVTRGIADEVRAINLPAGLPIRR